MQENREFSFDYVFSSEDTLEFVFESSVLRIIKRFISGFNGCIFTMGSVNSGKTYTMYGNSKSSNDDGNVPLILDHIINNVILKSEVDSKGKRVEYVIYYTFVEILDESIIDLLCDTTVIRNRKAFNIFPVVASPQSDGGKDIAIEGLTVVPLTAETNYRAVLEKANSRRHEKSHTIFSLTIESSSKTNADKKKSLLQLIDLAG
jgi:hypothetical protein